MLFHRARNRSETQKKRSLVQRMVVVHGVLLVFLLIIVARLMELQILRKADFASAAQTQHYGGVVLPARRGEILALSSKSGDTSILATNTTLDLLYVDPFVTDTPAYIADVLAEILLTPDYHALCSAGEEGCPREFLSFHQSPYAAAYDPLRLIRRFSTGALLEPLPDRLSELDPASVPLDIPDLTEVRRLFARDIERRISERSLTFMPVKYNATKPEMAAIRAMRLPGVYLNEEGRLIYANPEEIAPSSLEQVSRSLSDALDVEEEDLLYSLRRRPLRYVPIMRQLSPALSLVIKERKLASLKETDAKRAQATTRSEIGNIHDPLRGIALLPEHWRYYPDGTIASHVVGFLNNEQTAQYGIERSLDSLLRGREGLISAVSDLEGRSILTADQTIIDAHDGETVVLTIDPFIQKEVEAIMQEALVRYQAESAQALVMDPYTGRILSMVNVPLFDRSDYTGVYTKVPIRLDQGEEDRVVVEIFHPVTNARIVRGYRTDLFTEEGRAALPDDVRTQLEEAETLYDLTDLSRYYRYYGENGREEIFPTDIPGVWLKYENNIGVGAYLNRAVQEIYEPGSVMKPITMAIAIDHGEIAPTDTYQDDAPVEVDDFVIKNALLRYYGRVTMTNCLEFSINTCMTAISQKIGRKLFERMITRFGFGRATGIELEDELTGEVRPWRTWSNALLATASFGQGISSTPLQVITAFSAIANGGKLMQPHIIDRVIDADGTERRTEPRVIDQVIRQDTAETVTAMLVSSVNNGYAESAKVQGYKIAGKTGTSQIAGPGGRYETGTGSTFASFMGFAPPSRPKFIVLVKFDRPKNRSLSHGAQTAAPIFHDIAAFLFKYYGIPPDDV